MMLARPRVDMTSSCVAMNVGHIMPVCLRQPPQPLHCSRLPMNERTLNAKARRVENGPDMEQAARGMSVVARFQSERFHDRLQPADVIGQLHGTNRCVFNERDRFR